MSIGEYIFFIISGWVGGPPQGTLAKGGHPGHAGLCPINEPMIYIYPEGESVMMKRRKSHQKLKMSHRP